MIVHSLRNSISKQCSSALSVSKSTGRAMASTPANLLLLSDGFSTLHQWTLVDNKGDERYFSSQCPNYGSNHNGNNREFSSVSLPRKVNSNVQPNKIPIPPVVTKVPQPPSHKLNGHSGHVDPKSKTPLSSVMEEAKTEKPLDERTLSVPSPSHIAYVGNSEMPITSELKLITNEDDTPSGIWPVFRMMDENGMFRQTGIESATKSAKETPPKHDLDQLRAALESQYPHFAKELKSCSLLHPSKNPFPDTQSTNTLLRAQRNMIRLRKMDTILHNAQRQGRISFYMTNHGEEGIHIGSASALKPQDFVFAQYREAGILMWRGFTLEQFCNQCFSNDLDLGKGRQMPVHYGCRALNYQTISSPLGTQLTQAVGAAYKLKLDALNHPERQGRDPAIAITYFGDGAASSIDFHSACNFAATLRAPTIFFCRNNGYAISTPVTDQYAGDGIVSRAPGYGMAGIRVDGNDVFAVHAATQAAREYALETSSPVMIEAMTYRQGHHSTSDDSSRYRDTEEVQVATDVSDPMVRFDKFLKHWGWTDENEVASIEDEERIAVLRAMEGAEARPDPKLDTMFEDVYHEKPPHLVRQEEELMRHIRKHKIPHQ